MNTSRSRVFVRIASVACYSALLLACGEPKGGPADPAAVDNDSVDRGSERTELPMGARPNIILLLADDVAWVDLSGGQTNMGHGSGYHQTPNLDRLALEGLAFNSAYASQNCSPARAALLTGQYETRNRVYSVGSLNHPQGDSLLVGPRNADGIDPAAVTLAETLQGAGYVTAHFGKFHATMFVADILNDHGFDYNYGGRRQGSPGSYFAVRNSDGWEFSSQIGPGLDPFAGPYTSSYVDRYLVPFANQNDPSSLVGTPKHLNDGMADAAVDFMRRHLGSGRPFFMHVAFHAIHAPIDPRPDLMAKYEGFSSTDFRHRNAPYAALLEGMDQAIGRIIEFVDDPNGDGNTGDSIAASTLIVFVSDNGGSGGGIHNAPLSGGKGTMAEGGIRVPMIARMPGAIAAGTVSHEALHVVDLYPTICEIAGAPLPASSVHELDGESFALILAGDETELSRDAIYHHFPGYLDRRAAPSSTIIKEVDGHRYKLFYFYEDGRYELYELSADLGESIDLLAPSRITQAAYDTASNLSADLRGWLDATGAAYPIVRASGARAVLPGGPPKLTFALGRSAAPGLRARTMATRSVLGLTMSLRAVGGVFDQSSRGVSVSSSMEDRSEPSKEPGGDPSAGRQIEFNFDRSVALESIDLGSFCVDESVVLTASEGENPFVGLTGYTGNYSISGASLSYTRGEDAGATRVSFGGPGQDALLIPMGTVVAIGCDLAVDGEILLQAVSVEASPRG